MTGIDYEHADIVHREHFRFEEGQAAALDTAIRQQPGIEGCVVLSTCNRTELYVHGTEGASLDLTDLLCRAAGVDKNTCRRFFVSRSGREAVRHLTEVACGLRSQILGEDQIISQVRQAIKMAREVRSAGPVLETLFRCAITAGKETRAKTRLMGVPRSAAAKGVQLAERILGDLKGCRAVVIGNGEMGRLACENLTIRGAQVTMTLRSYRHGETIVPRGCNTVQYDQRLEAIDGVDLVVSATASPHCTISAVQAASLRRLPRLIIDLALPRDVDPAVGEMTMLLNIDDLGEDRTMCGKGFADVQETAGAEKNRMCLQKTDEDEKSQVCTKERDRIEEERVRVQEIVEKQVTRFYEWANYRDALPVIDLIKETAFQRIYIDAENGAEDGAEIRTAVEKTVDMLLGGMKENVTPELLENVLRKMKRRLSENRRRKEMKTERNPEQIRQGARFPLFLDMTGRRCVVFGAGRIGARRAQLLQEFGAVVTVVAPEGNFGVVPHRRRGYEERDLTGMFLAVAATRDRRVNQRIARDCASAGILCSVADCAEESTFYFPAVCTGGGLIAGIVSDGTKHAAVTNAAEAIRSILNEEEGV